MCLWVKCKLFLKFIAIMLKYCRKACNINNKCKYIQKDERVWKMLKLG